MVAPALNSVSDELLHEADRILLVDPARPGWHLTLKARHVLHGEARVEIPVDSADTMQLWEWHRRIAALPVGD